jgi:hypothetical protein
MVGADRSAPHVPIDFLTRAFNDPKTSPCKAMAAGHNATGAKMIHAVFDRCTRRRQLPTMMGRMKCNAASKLENRPKA